MALTNRLLVIGLATFVALAGVAAPPAPVSAADPTPTPDPITSPTPAPDPITSPTPDPIASPTPDPALTPTPDPALTPDPSLTPDPGTVLPVPTPVSVAPVVRPNLAARVVRIALAQRGKHYVRGASGPRAFDCSGLVRYAYRQAGVSRRIGGGHSARGMYHWARLRGLTSRTNPRVGDIVIYGGGTHAAIYIGHGLVISALNPRQGIRVTRLRALRAPFTAFIHTHLERP